MTAIDTSTEAVERLLEDVTPGPWVASYRSETDPDGDEYIDRVEVETPTDRYVHEFALGYSDEIDGVTEANARFIAAARDLVPALLKERDEARALVAAAVSRAEYHADRNTTAADVFRDISAIAKIKGADHE